MSYLVASGNQEPKFSDLAIFESFNFNSRTWIKSSNTQAISGTSIRLFFGRESVSI